MNSPQLGSEFLPQGVTGIRWRGTVRMRAISSSALQWLAAVTYFWQVALILSLEEGKSSSTRCQLVQLSHMTACNEWNWEEEGRSRLLSLLQQTTDPLLPLIQLTIFGSRGQHSGLALSFAAGCARAPTTCVYTSACPRRLLGVSAFRTRGGWIRT